MKSKLKPFDYTLFITVLMLLAIGLVVVLSASSHLGETSYNNPYYFFIRQVLWGVIGIVAMIFLSRIDYRLYKKLAFLIFIISIVLLVLVLIPGVGSGEVRGAKRWISLGFMSFQPSELAKIAIIIFLSASLSNNYKKLEKFWTGLVPYFGVILVVCALLFLEPHYSSLALIVAISLVLLFVAGAKIKHFVACILAILPVGIVGILISDYRLNRIFGFLDPWADPSGDGWQAIQSLYAIGSGGIFGLGIGQSRQKYLYLPDAHNDFILAILGEEFGLWGMILVISLFAIFIWRGIRIATKAPDMFGGLVAIGITMLVAIQVILNIAIVTAWFPVTGMPVPFLSYGGTSLVFFMSYVGILLNISRNMENI